jgi:membrane protein insertase Oxa1/YidC/SpoIIIJ
MPVLIALYNVFYQVLQGNDVTKVLNDINHVVYTSSLRLSTLDLSFFGSSLEVKPSQWQSHGYCLLAIPVITAALQWWQSKLMLPSSTPIKPGSTVNNQQITIKKKDAEKAPEDTAAEMQKQMAMITPIMFGMFAYQFPLGLALYWNGFGLFGIMQQLKINKEK